jgi:hypothetical protein
MRPFWMEEPSALASLALCMGIIAIWVQLLAGL